MAEMPNVALADHIRQHSCASSTDSGSDATPDDSREPDVESGPELRRDPLHVGLLPGLGVGTDNVIFKWWRKHNPFLLALCRRYGILLVEFLAPFTPGAARRLGFIKECQKAQKALYRLEECLPGARLRASKHRWRRCRKIYSSGHGTTVLLEGEAVSVGVAAAVVFAAAMWCSWRRSPPSWAVLLLELACGSAWAANYLAYADGRREGRLLRHRIVNLELALGPFFRATEACMRMVRCSQALSFGLRLSVPMPPVARMECSSHSHHGSGQPKITLRNLRIALADVLETAAKRSDILRLLENMPLSMPHRLSQESASVPSRESDDDRSTPATCGAPELLVGLSSEQRQITTNLHKTISLILERISHEMNQPEVWSIWWHSHLADVSDGVHGLADFFETASERLAVAICPRDATLWTTSGLNHGGDEAALAAQILSRLRLRYEEVIVRLYSCQNSVKAITCDPSSSAPDDWAVIKEELTRAKDTAYSEEDRSWHQITRLVNSMDGAVGEASDVQASSADLHSVTHSPADRHHVDAGVEWVSLSSPTRPEPETFEGGSCDYPASQASPPQSTTAPKTDVLVGVASPRDESRRAHGESRGDEMQTAKPTEASCSELMSELDTVLKARPYPPTSEKTLPLESQRAISTEEMNSDHDSEGLDVTSRMPDPPSLSEESRSPPPLPTASIPHAPHSGGDVGSNDMMSELRAQLSMAANEEIFGSDRDAWACDSDKDEIFVSSDRRRDSIPTVPSEDV